MRWYDFRLGCLEATDISKLHDGLTYNFLA